MQILFSLSKTDFHCVSFQGFISTFYQVYKKWVRSASSINKVNKVSLGGFPPSLERRNKWDRGSRIKSIPFVSSERCWDAGKEVWMESEYRPLCVSRSRYLASKLIFVLLLLLLSIVSAGGGLIMLCWPGVPRGQFSHHHNNTVAN